jgi:hypothetical protein
MTSKSNLKFNDDAQFAWRPASVSFSAYPGLADDPDVAIGTVRMIAVVFAGFAYRGSERGVAAQHQRHVMPSQTGNRAEASKSELKNRSRSD